MNNTPTLQIIAIALALMSILGGCSQDLPASHAPIKIGVIGAFTGNLANLAADERIGLEIARDEINSAGGIGGRPIELIFEDGKCDAKEALTAATKIAEVDGVSVILGGTCTGESMSTAKVANASGIVQLSAMTSGSIYSETGEWTFRTNPVDNAKDLADLLLSLGYKRYAIISEQTDFSQSIRKDFVRWITEGGALIVADEQFQTSDQDFRTQLAKIKESGADAVFLNPQSGTTGILLAKQSKDLGIAPLFGSRPYEAAKIEGSEDALEGVVFYGSAGVVDMTRAESQKLFGEYQKRMGRDPFSPFAAASRYDDVKLIAAALGECDEDAACIRDWLYAMKPYDGAIGTFSFDTLGDPVGVKYAFSVFKDGKIKQYKP